MSGVHEGKQTLLARGPTARVLQPTARAWFSTNLFLAIWIVMRAATEAHQRYAFL
jgi:hypothetical protein